MNQTEKGKSERCPSCRTETPLRKSWVLRRGKGSKKTAYRIFLYTCPKCGRSFRRSKKVEGGRDN